MENIESLESAKYLYEIKENFVKHISKINYDSSFFIIATLMKQCEGKVITTGVGKAGIVMQKFTATLCSMGVSSAFLSPLNASHGDLGLLGKNDILFVASTSGKTREVLEVIDLAKEINNNPVVGITSHKESPLKNKVDYLIDMGEIKEAGSIGLAPTTSILVMLALTDSLALLVSESIGFSKEDFGKYHHGGYLGEQCRR